jgi:hypothetical protein
VVSTDSPTIGVLDVSTLVTDGPAAFRIPLYMIVSYLVREGQSVCHEYFRRSSERTGDV